MVELCSRLRRYATFLLLGFLLLPASAQTAMAYPVELTVAARASIGTDPSWLAASGEKNAVHAAGEANQTGDADHRPHGHCSQVQAILDPTVAAAPPTSMAGQDLPGVAQALLARHPLAGPERPPRS